MLTPEEREFLKELANADQRMVSRRALVLLALDQGQSSVLVAQQQKLHPAAVRRIKQRFLSQRLELLQVKKRPGRSPDKRQTVERFLASFEQRKENCPCEQGGLSAAAIRQELQNEQHVTVCINTVRSALKQREQATGGD